MEKDAGKVWRIAMKPTEGHQEETMNGTRDDWEMRGLEAASLQGYAIFELVAKRLEGTKGARGIVR